MDWSSYYDAFVDEEAPKEESKPPRMKQDVEVVDIGCGFGGLLVGLAPVLPDKLILGAPLPFCSHGIKSLETNVTS